MLALYLMLPLALQEASVEKGQATGFPGTPAGRNPVVEIPWNRLYDWDEVYSLFDRLAAAHPKLVGMQVIGTSVESRELRVYTLNHPETGADTRKPAMWIDGNVHGNEVQGAEAVLYTAWYLLENYGHNERVTRLLDGNAFYMLPMVNPDGRASWFRDAHSASSSRTGRQPIDDDGDGLFDEDGPDDLDGDGELVQMRKHVPGEGTHRLNPDDPRILEPVPLPVSPERRDVRGDWILLGGEGLDNDGDGRINEDGPGGYDMNRSSPSLWMPEHVQGGAGPYPLYWPETRSIARFLYDHPNIAALQSFHNAGGMILRGPGAEVFGEYAGQDLRAYDELGRDGEKMLPFYRYMVIWKDLYTVFGGFATWGYEGLGVISFTNELWNDDQMYPDASKTDVPRGTQGQHFFNDALLMGAGFVDWHVYEHPLYGRIELGGFRKDVGRVPPSFLIEEMVHRNAMFCLEHAAAMPRVVVRKLEASDLGGGVRAVDAIFRNEHVIPTRTARAAQMKIGAPDLFTLESLGEGPGVEVLAGGFRQDRFRPERIELARREPSRLISESGIPGRSELRVRWFVRGRGSVRATFQGDKASTVSARLELP